jgi:ABC-type uncharacterized transport system involved in gliding motility auxiliary subunit
MARNRGLDRQKLAALGVALAVVCFVALNTFGSLSLRGLRLDLTENRQFTLSGGTERMLARIGEPVTLRLYVSQAVREANPFLASYADRVHDMLRGYAAASNGRIAVEYVDPEPFSPEEDRAVGFGLEAVALDNQGTTGYFGMAGTNSTDDVDVIPVLSPERETFLEYDLTRMVYNLANPDKPVVAVLSSLPVNGDPALNYQPWQFLQELGQFFELRHLGGDVARLDDDVRLLLLVQPQELSDKTLYAIDQFVMRGGEALVFVDPHSEAQALRQRQGGGPPPETASDLPKLFQSWGVELVADKVVGDPAAARQVSFPSGGRDQVIDYLPWLALDERNLAEGEVILAELNQLNLGTAGILKPREGATTAFSPLLRSSPQAAAVEADKVRVYPDPFALIRDFKPGGESLVMAARVTGPAKSAFPGRPEGDAEAPEHVAEAREPINVVVVADTDLLDDRNWLAGQAVFGQRVQVPVADNASLVANALDYLAGSDTLLDLRGREVTLRPFTKVAEIRREAEIRYRAKEQELLQKLGDLQQKLSAARVGPEGGEEGALLSQRQREEIEGFRGQLLETRRELREVQLALRQDIDGLQDRVRFLGTAAVPILVALLAVGVALFKRARYRRRVADATAAAAAAA